MNEPFIISVTYQGNECELKARFERLGFTHCIAVLIGETTFTFEPDEEGGYRALGAGPADFNLLRAVAEKLATLNGPTA